MATMEDQILQLANVIQESNFTVAVTGSGISLSAGRRMMWEINSLYKFIDIMGFIPYTGFEREESMVFT